MNNGTLEMEDKNCITVAHCCGGIFRAYDHGDYRPRISLLVDSILDGICGSCRERLVQSLGKLCSGHNRYASWHLLLHVWRTFVFQTARSLVRANCSSHAALGYRMEVARTRSVSYELELSCQLVEVYVLSSGVT